MAKGHRDAVNDVKFSPDGHYLVSASHDTTIRIWQTETGACAMILDDSVGAVKKLCYSPLECHMMSISGPGNFVSVWNTTSYVVEKVLEADNGREIQNIAITPDGMVIIGLSEDNKITLWATMTDNCVPKRRTTPHIKGLTTIALHDDGNEWCIATADRDEVINIWN
ncbi:vegetative incompatibility protein HET-E-1-like [Xenia sp. Carnegie-2017]|uniref:vegetative incompatibility protein HET-E-1-like n=1 Tax=Xenia sp. Carnegie-2017 TaxID=2897299 RepID=UPI001F04D383|nr:vegetative incompatibility protein HET-E-1-like [Xenia sp. Carnegie-2017]